MATKTRSHLIFLERVMRLASVFAINFSVSNKAHASTFYYLLAHVHVRVTFVLEFLTGGSQGFPENVK